MQTKQRITGLSPNECSRCSPSIEARPCCCCSEPTVTFSVIGDDLDCTPPKWVHWPTAIVCFTCCVYVVAVLRVAAWLTEQLYYWVNA